MPKKLPRGINMVNDTYRVRMFHDGKQHSIGTYQTLGDAKAALSIARADAARGIFTPPAERRRQQAQMRELEQQKAVTVADLAADWLEHLDRVGRAKSTIVTHRSTLNVHILPVLGDIPVAGITPEMIQTLLDDIDTEIPRRNAGRTLQTLFNHAVKQRAGGIAVSPFQATIARPKTSRARIDREKIATPAEVEALTAEMPAPLALAVPLAAWCCLRLGEVLGLARDDLTNLDDTKRAALSVDRQVNAKANAITHPKAESYRTIAIPAFMVPMIQTHLAEHVSAGKESPLFAGQGVGGRISQSAFDRQWRAARDKVKPGFKFHDLRHSGLTHFAQAGATLAELMLRGGHTDVSVALRYQTATAERDRALTDIMESMLHTAEGEEK